MACVGLLEALSPKSRELQLLPFGGTRELLSTRLVVCGTVVSLFLESVPDCHSPGYPPAMRPRLDGAAMKWVLDA